MNKDNPYSIAVLKGDGVGPEVVAESIRCLKEVEPLCSRVFSFEYYAAGGEAIDEGGNPLPEKTLEACLASDAILKGPWGGPRWDNLPTESRPERGILRLRKALDAFANLRPVKIYPSLVGTSPLRPDLAVQCDFLIIRELVSGLYFGEPRGIEGDAGNRRAYNTLAYTESEIRRVVDLGFKLARERGGRLVSVHKGNVLETFRLWADVAEEVAKENKDVEFEQMIVDRCAMEILLNPGQFDVMVMGNMFGDILSDEGAAVVGSLGLLPSASLGGGDKPGLFEPVHGSAPDLAGRGEANPLAAILSCGMLLKHGLGEEKAAGVLSEAVENVLAEGFRTPDLAHPGSKTVSTSGMGEVIVEEIKKKVN